MDIRSLSCFVAVAETLHFGRAATRLHLTQPALSQRIKALEEEIGAELFARSRRHVALTPSGEAFLEPARAAVIQANRAKLQARRALQGEAGRLRLGFTVIAFYGMLPEAVQAFRRRYPDVVVELSEMNSPTLEAALEQGTLDLGILHPPLATPGLSMRALPEEPLLLALPERHRLAAHDIVAIHDLGDEPLLVAPRAIGPHFYDRIVALFQGAGISPRFVQEVTPMTTLVGLVATGAGLGFVARGIAETGRPGVVFRPVEPAPPALPMAAAWAGAAPSAPAQRLLEVVEAAIISRGRPGSPLRPASST